MSVMFATRLDKSTRSISKDGKMPIVIQITWNRNVRRKRIGLSVHEHQFHVYKDLRRKKERVELSGMHKVKDKQDFIDSELERAKEIYQKKFANRPFNYKSFVEEFDKIEPEIDPNSIMVADFCDTVAEQFEREGRASSAHYYRFTGVAVRKVAPNDISFSEFDSYWLKHFVQVSQERGIKSYNYLVHLRALFNKAVEEGIVDYSLNPFKNPYTNPRGFDLSKYKKSKISQTNKNKIKDLSRKQLIQIKELNNLSEIQRKYLAIWWFSFYCFGVNLIDVAKLRYKDIRDGRWYYSRSKTDVTLRTGKPLLPEALAIIEEYGTGGEYVFDILPGFDKSEKQITARVLSYAGYIRDACVRVSKKAELHGYFTYYSARYSSATLALNEGADRNTVSHLLDHENFSTIDNYAGKADDTKVLAAMEILRI